MTLAILLAVLCVVLTAAVVAVVVSPDRRRSWHTLPDEFRVWSVESPRKVDHE